MPKERINVTVDEDVKRELDQRPDINVSGAVNDFLRQLLLGQTGDEAKKRAKVEHHRKLADEKLEEAKQHEHEAELLEQELETARRTKRNELEQAITKVDVTSLRSSDGPVVQTDREQLEQIATQHDVSVAELTDAAKRQYTDDAGDAGVADRSFR